MNHDPAQFSHRLNEARWNIQNINSFKSTFDIKSNFEPAEICQKVTTIDYKYNSLFIAMLADVRKAAYNQSCEQSLREKKRNEGTCL